MGSTDRPLSSQRLDGQRTRQGLEGIEGNHSAISDPHALQSQENITADRSCSQNSSLIDQRACSFQSGELSVGLPNEIATLEFHPGPSLAPRLKNRSIRDRARKKSRLKIVAAWHHQSMMKASNRLDPHIVRQICVETPCAPQTVIRIYEGRLVKPLSMHRVRAALQRLNMLHLFPGLETVVIGPAAERSRTAP